MQKFLFTFFLALIPLALFAQSKRDPLKEFTILAILSSVVVIGLWLMLWWKKRKK